MTTKTQSDKSRQRYSQQYKSKSLALAEQFGGRQQPSNWGFKKANCTTEEEVPVFYKTEAPWKNGFWRKTPDSNANWLNKPRSWPS